MNRKRISPKDRQVIYSKYDSHCAYCGKELTIEEMQVDHLKPLRLGGEDEMSNYMPTCRMCNHYKRGNTLEGFRKAIERKLPRLHCAQRGMIAPGQFPRKKLSGDHLPHTLQ